MPVNGPGDRDVAWADVVKGIREKINAIRQGETTMADEVTGGNQLRAANAVRSAHVGASVTSGYVPIPRYPDERTRHVSEDIRCAHGRRSRLLANGSYAEAALVDKEILGLRRQLRAGGQLKAGDSLGEDRFLLLDQVGQGGYAVVWKAYDSQVGMNVAIKVMHPNVAGDEIKRSRFVRGATRMAALGHPAVVPIIEQCSKDDGFYYYVMEFLSGGDLKQAVLNERLAGDQIFPVILRVADALGAAHARGWVHRDVKPANILLNELHEPYLCDFDLVAAVDTTGGTRTSMMGTFLYSAPETMDRPQDVDARADVYSLGMTTLFCLHGSALPRSVIGSAEPIIRRLNCQDRVKGVIRRAIRSDARERFVDAREFSDALKRAVCDDDVNVVNLPTKKSVAQPARGVERTSVVELISIPGGTFDMGATDAFAKPEEGPVLTVGISSYLVFKYPVSRRIFQKVMGLSVARKNKDLPIEVTWFQAVEFCNKISVAEGFEAVYAYEGNSIIWQRQADGYRLLTEAEWEYAARGTDGRLYPWGDEPPSTQLCWKQPSGPSPVDSHPDGASPFGVVDMVGNVREWCWDWYARYVSARANPIGPVNGFKRVARGGDWRSFAPAHVRATGRVGLSQNDQAGFRCARARVIATVPAESSSKPHLRKPQ